MYWVDLYPGMLVARLDKPKQLLGEVVNVKSKGRNVTVAIVDGNGVADTKHPVSGYPAEELMPFHTNKDKQRLAAGVDRE